MPRQARIDAPGAVHHVMVRGIERRKIFGDKSILCQEDPYLRELMRYLPLNPYFYMNGPLLLLFPSIFTINTTTRANITPQKSNENNPWE